MAKSRLSTLITSVVLIAGLTACGPSLVIQNVDYSQPIESVLETDGTNQVNDQRYGIRFNVTPVLTEEGVTSVDEIRLIRNNKGYYFITAAGFSNVYVLEPAESELKLKRIITLSVEGLSRPALNQRGNYIEVIDRATGQTYRVNEEGSIGG